MDWISSLFDLNCPFCDSRLGNPVRACLFCAEQLALLESETNDLKFTAVQELKVYSLAPYEGFLKTLLIQQKRNYNSVIGKWFASWISQKAGFLMREPYLVWVPGAVFTPDAHLVEHLALELSKLNVKLFPFSCLSRLPFSKSQKILSSKLRKEQIEEPRFYTRGNAQNIEVLLLDDILTTGSTLLGCSRLLKEKLHFSVKGALTLAYTPLYISRKAQHENSASQIA